MFIHSGEASAKTGMHPSATTGMIAPWSVIGAEMTSVPARRRRAASAEWIAAVPALMPVANFVPTAAANSCS